MVKVPIVPNVKRRALDHASEPLTLLGEGLDLPLQPVIRTTDEMTMEVQVSRVPHIERPVLLGPPQRANVDVHLIEILRLPSLESDLEPERLVHDALGVDLLESHSVELHDASASIDLGRDQALLLKPPHGFT